MFQASVTIPAPAFEELTARLCGGDDEAAAEVFRRFTHRPIGLARGRLDHLIRRKVDPEDILQSVYRIFFSRCACGSFSLGNWDSLWGRPPHMSGGYSPSSTGCPCHSCCTVMAGLLRRTDWSTDATHATGM